MVSSSSPSSIASGLSIGVSTGVFSFSCFDPPPPTGPVDDSTNPVRGALRSNAAIGSPSSIAPFDSTVVPA